MAISTPNPKGSGTLWQNIRDEFKADCIPLPVPYGELFCVNIPPTDALPTQTRWLIGPYKRLTNLATALRNNEPPRKLLSDLQVRLGLRKTDIPPTGKRERGYGDSVPGVPAGTIFAPSRKVQHALPVPDLQWEDRSRRTDREQNVLAYWQSQTPQSHHIVEYNNLRDIGVSKKDEKGSGEMDYGQLPAVLLAADFHQGYISTFLGKLHGMDEAKLRAQMPGIYHSLYEVQSTLFKPLWRISVEILRKSGFNVA